MWRGIVHKATVLPSLVWATVCSAAARWSKFPFKIKWKARGKRLGIAKKHCTQAGMWNPAWGGQRALLLYLLLSSLIIFLPTCFPSSFISKSDQPMEGERCEGGEQRLQILSRKVHWPGWKLHNCNSVITYWLLRETPKFIKWTCWVRLSCNCL